MRRDLDVPDPIRRPMEKDGHLVARVAGSAVVTRRRLLPCLNRGILDVKDGEVVNEVYAIVTATSAAWDGTPWKGPS